MTDQPLLSAYFNAAWISLLGCLANSSSLFYPLLVSVSPMRIVFSSDGSCQPIIGNHACKESASRKTDKSLCIALPTPPPGWGGRRRRGAPQACSASRVPRTQIPWTQGTHLSRDSRSSHVSSAVKSRELYPENPQTVSGFQILGSPLRSGRVQRRRLRNPRPRPGPGARVGAR